MTKHIRPRLIIIVLGYIGISLDILMPLMFIIFYRSIHEENYFGFFWLMGMMLSVTSGLLLIKDDKYGPLFLGIAVASFLIGLFCPAS